MAAKRYKTILADPPWPIRWGGGGIKDSRGSGMPYGLMTLDEIKTMPVADMADPTGCHLYLWVTPELHRNGEGLKTLEAWGFDFVGEIIWFKPNFGMGAFPRPQHEPLLIGRIGKLPFSRRDVGTVQRWPQPYSGGAKIHSAKPDGSIDLIESASPEPRVELFARRSRLTGWDYWGDQSLETAVMA